MQALIGIFVLLGLAWLLSENRQSPPWRLLGVGVALQFLLAVLFVARHPTDKKLDHQILPRHSGHKALVFAGLKKWVLNLARQRVHQKVYLTAHRWALMTVHQMVHCSVRVLQMAHNSVPAMVPGRRWAETMAH